MCRTCVLWVVKQISVIKSLDLKSTAWRMWCNVIPVMLIANTMTLHKSAWINNYCSQTESLEKFVPYKITTLYGLMTAGAQLFKRWGDLSISTDTSSCVAGKRNSSESSFAFFFFFFLYREVILFFFTVAQPGSEEEGWSRSCVAEVLSVSIRSSSSFTLQQRLT